MTRGKRILPYRTASDAAVTWESWWYERADSRLPLPKMLPGWDYASELVVGLTATIDAETLLESTNLDALDQVSLVLIGDCALSLRRFTSTARLAVGSKLVDVELRIPPGQAADSLDLSAMMVLAEDLAPGINRAQRAGSKLAWSSSHKLILEGDASRFPTEPLSFSTAGFEPAPWTLTWNAENLTDNLMSTVRLLINEDHPWGQALLADADTEVAKSLHVDVFRGLVLICAGLGDDPSDELEGDSLGGVVDYMCQLYLRRSLGEAIKVAREEPLRFDRLIYAAVTA